MSTMLRKTAIQLGKLQIMLIAKTTTIIAFVAVFFYQDLITLFTNVIENKTTLYMLIVPFLAGYIIYHKRKILGVVGVEEEQIKYRRKNYILQAIGILLVLLAIFIYWFGNYTFTPLEYHMLSLPLLTIGLVLFFFNLQTLRHIALPIVFLFFLVPPPQEILYSIGANILFLGTLLLMIIHEKLLKTRDFSTLNCKCLKYTPASTSSKVFCLECGIITNHLTNSIRKTDLAKTSLVVVVAIILVSLQAPVFTLTQTKPIVALFTSQGEQFSTEILPELKDYTLIFDSRDKEFETSANLDMALVYIYRPKDLKEQEVWVTIEIGTTLSRFRIWETYLIANRVARGLEPEATKIALQDDDLLQIPQITGRFFVFNYTKTGITQAVLYWFEDSPFAVNSTFQQKRIKISVTTYPEALIELSSIHNNMVALATEIARYWQPIKTWSQTTLILSSNSSTLVGITIAGIVLFLIMIFFEIRKKQMDNSKIYNKLSNENRIIIDAIKQTEQTSIPTIRNIAITIQRQKGKEINKTALVDQLQELEKTGLIKNDIISIQQEPIQTWKTRFIQDKVIEKT